MRHFGSLVLALILAPVIWVAVAFGPNRLARSTLDLPNSGDTDRYLGIGLLLVAAVALGVLLVFRFSPLGPALAGLGFLAVSALGLSASSPVYDLGKDLLGNENQQTLVSPVATGYLWLAGFLLLMPVLVPSRWRKARTAGAATGAAAPAGPNGPGNPNSHGGPSRYRPGTGPRSESAPDQPTAIAAPIGSDRAPGDGGYHPEGEYAPASGWDSPPQQPPGGQGGASPYGTTPYPAGTNYPPSTYGAGHTEANGPDFNRDQPGSNAADPYYPPYGERPLQSPGSAQFPSASPYPGPAGAGNQYPASTYSAAPSEAPGPGAHPAPPYPTTYSAPEQPPGPTSYAPTVYGRSRSADDTDPSTASAPPDTDDPQETRRLP